MYGVQGRIGLARWLLLMPLMAGGCAATQPQSEEQVPAEEELADILSQPLEAEEYGTPRRCISRYAYRDFEPLGDRYVVFEGAGDALWLNELRGRCHGLDRASALAFEGRGNQLCYLDRFKVTDWFSLARFRRPPWDWMDGIPCTLGKFQPVSGEQLEAIRAALDQR